MMTPVLVKHRVALWLAEKGFENAYFDGDNRCFVRDESGQDVLLSVCDEHPVLNVYFQLFSLAQENRLDLIVFAMSLNLDPDKVGGLTLGFEPESQQILASIQLDFSVLPLDVLDEKIIGALEYSAIVKDELSSFYLHDHSRSSQQPEVLIGAGLKHRDSLLERDGLLSAETTELSNQETTELSNQETTELSNQETTELSNQEATDSQSSPGGLTRYPFVFLKK